VGSARTEATSPAHSTTTAPAAHSACWSSWRVLLQRPAALAGMWWCQPTIGGARTIRRRGSAPGLGSMPGDPSIICLLSGCAVLTTRSPRTIVEDVTGMTGLDRGGCFQVASRAAQSR
jgi:hypothetical protein